jgi:glycosyltransferase involved in cell wall biosynthesis
VKDIVIIANFCRDFSESDNGRFMYLCKELCKNNKVEIITNDFDHATKKQKAPIVHNWPFTITFLHEPGYKKNISIQRFASHRAWGKEVEKYLKIREKPDVVYCAVPSLTAPLLTSKYCEKNEIRFIIDIQDLWPEAFQMVLNIPVVSNVLFSPFMHMANEIYKRADAVCGVSQRYVDRAISVNRKCKSGHAVFLGTSLDSFDNNVSHAKAVVKKAEGEIWLGYCGSLSASYDIPCVIDALKILKDQGKVVPKFIIMGDGARRAEFEQDAKSAGIDAVFTGKLPYDRMCAQLVQCDIVVNPIVKRSAASIINKHGDYASAGRAVINTQDSPEYRELIEEYKMGLNCENGNTADVAEKLEELVENSQLRMNMGQNARRCAEEKFDRKHSYRELINCILE